MIHSPPSDHRVELPYQCRLRCVSIALDDSSDLVQQRFNALLSWLGQQLVAVLSDILPEEVEPFLDMRDSGFFLRQLQPTIRQEAMDARENFGFEYVLRRTGHHKIIRITDDVDLGLPARTVRTGTRTHRLFQAIKRHVRNYGRDDSSLRRARPRLEQGSLIDVAGRQPLAQDRFIHRYVLQEPGVTEVVETTSDVTLQHPLRRHASRQSRDALFDGIGS